MPYLCVEDSHFKYVNKFQERDFERQSGKNPNISCSVKQQTVMKQLLS
jgi:hypothetical protein